MADQTNQMSVDELCVNSLRFLAVDAVEKANSGHPGTPLGAAPAAYVLWDRYLRHNPRDPDWFNRDRFVLSAGHASALLYALLHCYDYGLPREEIKEFRQWGSQTPGHPEYGHTPGVETTTGPLGQGFANGVGMAIAERVLAQHLNEPDYPVVDHYTYALCSDGDLMEGISSEAASLAGHVGLGKLIYVYDDNETTIDGKTHLTYSEDVKLRFEGHGWQVLEVADANDLEALDSAIARARSTEDKPSLINVPSHIGYGSPVQDQSAAHGKPLGEEGVRRTKQTLGWPEDKTFYVPRTARDHFHERREEGEKRQQQWEKMLEDYRRDHPEQYDRLKRAMDGQLAKGWNENGDAPYKPADGPLSTRDAIGTALDHFSQRIWNLVGGSADLAGSNRTYREQSGDLHTDDPDPQNIHFGVREHSMAGIVNGMTVHGGLVPFGATFLIFSDYMRPSLRLAALMGIPANFVFTHDSIGVGEDGPTHQPVEQVPSLRAIPNFTVIRPADGNEAAAAWPALLEHNDGPVAIVGTRQKLPVLEPDLVDGENVRKGGYILEEESGDKPDLLLVGSGSEVHLLRDAREILRAEDDLDVRVVSMPAMDWFKQQPDSYRNEVLPENIPSLAVEAAAPAGWYELLGHPADVLGLERFGASAPGEVVMENLGFTRDNVLEHARNVLKQPS